MIASSINSLNKVAFSIGRKLKNLRIFLDEFLYQLNYIVIFEFFSLI